MFPSFKVLGIKYLKFQDFSVSVYTDDIAHDTNDNVNNNKKRGKRTNQLLGWQESRINKTRD
jgi:hypothetical protein